MYKRSIVGVKCLRAKEISTYENKVLNSNCWICEGWNEYCFEYKQGKSHIINRP